ncbi:hypothetical protein HK098_004143 [Nowakowskiella sp. JEL0407]|nr:hypothetical protein HK098_004143 [Nowakowskiella sp. JEL0407]
MTELAQFSLIFEGDELAVELIETEWTKFLDAIKAIQSQRNSGVEIPLETDLQLNQITISFLQFWEQQSLIPPNSTTVFESLCETNQKADELSASEHYSTRQINILRDNLLLVDKSLGENQSSMMKTVYNLLNSFLKRCVKKLKHLHAELNLISAELLPVYDHLVEIKHSLQSLLNFNQPHAFSLIEVQTLQDQLREIDSAKVDGKFIAEDGTIVAGQGRVIDLMESCFEDVHELLASRDTVGGDNPLRDVYEKLVDIRGQLEKIELSRGWCDSSTAQDVEKSLYALQLRLGEIDNLRVDGKFLAEDGSIPEGQAVLHFLLHKCYRLVHKLQVQSEPVAVELVGLKNQLETLNKCLDQLVRWKVKLDDEELVPYQLKIARIDSKRVDGKFMVDGTVPEGQGLLHSLLHDCYEKIAELKDSNE